MKTSDLTGLALDWAVARAEKHCVEHLGGTWFYIPMMDQNRIGTGYSPSTQWWRGGPIIEREIIDVMSCDGGDYWKAHIYLADEWIEQFGPTPLIAAMLCYCTSRLGNEIEIPEELK